MIKFDIFNYFGVNKMSVPTINDLKRLTVPELITGISQSTDQRLYLGNVLIGHREPQLSSDDVIELLRATSPGAIPFLVETLFIYSHIAALEPIIIFAISHCSQSALGVLATMLVNNARQDIGDFLGRVLNRFEPTKMPEFLDAIDLEKTCEYGDVPDLITKMIRHCAPQGRYTLMRALTTRILDAEQYCLKAITGIDYNEQIRILKIFSGCTLFSQPIYLNNVLLQLSRADEATNRQEITDILRQSLPNRFQGVAPAGILPMLLRQPTQNRTEENFVIQTCLQTDISKVLKCFQQVTLDILIIAFGRTNGKDYGKLIGTQQVTKLGLLTLIKQIQPQNIVSLYKAVWPLDTYESIKYAVANTSIIAYNAHMHSIELFALLCITIPEIRNTTVLTTAIKTAWTSLCAEMIDTFDFTRTISTNAAVAIANLYIDRTAKTDQLIPVMLSLKQWRILKPEVFTNAITKCSSEDVIRIVRVFDNLIKHNGTIAQLAYDHAHRRHRVEIMGWFDPGLIVEHNNESPNDDSDDEEMPDQSSIDDDASIHDPNATSVAAQAQTIDHQLAIGMDTTRINRIINMDSVMVLNTIADWQSITDDEWREILARVDPIHYLVLWIEHSNAIPTACFEKMVETIPVGSILELLSRNANPTDKAIDTAVSRTRKTRDYVINYSFNKAAEFLGHIRLRLNPYVGKIPARYTNMCSDLITLAEMDYTTPNFFDGMYVIFMHDMAWCLSRKDLQAMFGLTDTWRYECVGDPINPKEYPRIVNPRANEYHQHPDTQKYKPLAHLGPIWVLAGQLYNVLRRPGGAFFISEQAAGKYINVVSGSMFTPHPSLVGTAHCSGDEDYYEIFTLNDDNFRTTTQKVTRTSNRRRKTFA